MKGKIMGGRILRTGMPERHMLLTYAWPILLELFLTSLIGTASNYYVNAFSGDAIAVVGSLSQIVNFVINLYTIISVGGSILLAPLYGSGKYDRCSNVIRTMVLGNLIFSLLVSVGATLAAEHLIRMMHIEERLHSMGMGYLTVCLALSFVQSMLITLTAVFRSFGWMRTVLVANFTVFGLCLLLNMAIYYWIPSTGQHLWMYALGGIAGQLAGVLILALQLFKWYRTFFRGCCRRNGSGEKSGFKRRHMHRIGIDLRNSVVLLGKILSYGIYAGSEGLIYLAGLAICTSIMGLLGTRALLVRSYAGLITGYVEISVSAMAAAVFPRIGQNFGRKDFNGMRCDLREGLRISAELTAVVGFAFLMFSKAFLMPFTRDLSVIRDTQVIVALQLFVEVFKVPAALGVPALKAIGKTRIPFLLIIISTGIEIVLSYFLGIVCGLGLGGIYLGYAADNAFRVVWLYLAWKKYSRDDQADQLLRQVED